MLREIGVPFTIVSSAAEEVLEGGVASVIAEENALAKARGAVLPADVGSGAFVLGTDTLVSISGRVLGKPRSRDEAREMLQLLSGRRHEVVSGVALLRLGAPPQCAEVALRVASAVTEVTFERLGRSHMEAYLATGEWKDKAGAYAVQGLAGLFVRRVRGEYSNVVGLPYCLLAHLFRELGFDLLTRAWWHPQLKSL